MSRTKKILMGQDFIDERTFKGATVLTQNTHYNIVIVNGFDKEYFAQAIEAIPKDYIPPTNYYSSQRSSVPVRKITAEKLYKINDDYLKVNRPTIPVDIREELSKIGAYGFLSETPFLSVFMLNEFLAQDVFDVYHDFLNEHWDDFYEDAVAFKITMYAHTPKVYKHLRGNSFINLRPKATKKIQRVVEDLTKAQLLGLITMNNPTYVDDSSVTLLIGNLLKKKAGSIERQATRREAVNQIYRLMSMAVVNTSSRTPLTLSRIYASFQEAMETVSDRIANDPVKYTANEITANDMMTITTFLEENIEAFAIDEVFFILYSLGNHKIFARTGKTVEMADLYLNFIKKDNAIEIFKMIAELGTSYNKILPTMLQWKNGLKAGDLDSIFTADLTVMLVHNDDKETDRTGQVKEYRSIFGKDA